MRLTPIQCQLGSDSDSKSVSEAEAECESESEAEAEAEAESLFAGPAEYLFVLSPHEVRLQQVAAVAVVLKFTLGLP